MRNAYWLDVKTRGILGDSRSLSASRKHADRAALLHSNFHVHGQMMVLDHSWGPVPVPFRGGP